MEKPDNDASEQAVIVLFEYGTPNLDPIFQLEDKLETVISEAGVGEFDGNEIAVDSSNGTLFMYGPDADKLFHVIKPVLASSAFMKGVQVTLRYGPPEDGVKEIQIILGK